MKLKNWGILHRSYIEYCFCCCVVALIIYLKQVSKKNVYQNSQVPPPPPCPRPSLLLLSPPSSIKLPSALKRAAPNAKEMPQSWESTIPVAANIFGALCCVWCSHRSVGCLLHVTNVKTFVMNAAVAELSVISTMHPYAPDLMIANLSSYIFSFTIGVLKVSFKIGKKSLYLAPLLFI